MSELSKLRHQIAMNALKDLDQTLENVWQRYDRKQALKGVLHDESAKGINRTIVSINSFLAQIRTNTKNQSDGGKIPEEIESVIKFAETRVSELTDRIEKARDLAKDLQEFEIYDGAFRERKKNLYSRGVGNLKRTSDALLDLHKIWDEAFALVSGLCLRHEGLDGGLCRIADVLIGEINWLGARVFTLPGRGRPGMVSRIVLLNFPEWTVWALPLAAQGLWHLAVRDSSYSDDTRTLTGVLQSMLEVCGEKDENLAKELRDSAPAIWGDDNFQDCLGDVYGTYSLGPAYACACICLDLVLDPKSKKSEQRALSIFRTLESEPDFVPIADQLKRRWRDAVPVAGVLENPMWIDSALMYLKSLAEPFGIDRWKQYRVDLVAKLGSGDVDKLEPGDLLYKYLLSAAWKARFDKEESVSTVLTSFMKMSDKLLANARVRSTRPTAVN